jgi:hypothetical protein
VGRGLVFVSMSVLEPVLVAVVRGGQCVVWREFDGRQEGMRAGVVSLMSSTQLLACLSRCT